jgi:hypothetical protein
MGNPETKYKIRHTTIESAALGFCRIQNILSNSKKLGKEKEYRAFMKDVIQHLRDKSSICDMGLLFNALTEKRHADVLLSLDNEEDPMIIQADSGGLQQITLGIKVTEQDKIDIYKRQAKYSTHSMSFDKMPILVDETARDQMGVSMSLNHSAKYFVRELLYESGFESGKNIIDQCQEIEKMPPDEVRSKILIILQGSAFEDYQEYSRGLFDSFNELPVEKRDKYYNYIGGISFGMSGITNYFELFDIYARAAIELTNVPEQFRGMLHFLGAGGMTKIGPLYALQDSYFGKDVHFTFDSTSRTSSSTYGIFTQLREKGDGLYMKKGKIGRKINATTLKFLDDVYQEFKPLLEKHFDYDISTLEKFRNTFSNYRDDGLRLIKELTDKYGDDKGTEYYVNGTGIADFLFWASETVKFFRILEEFHSGRFGLVTDKQIRKGLERLSTVENYDDYMKNHREFLRLLLKDKTLGNINVVETVDEFYGIVNSGIDDEEW